MGRWFKRAFEKAGHEVLVADLNTPLKPQDLVQDCAVIFVSVPMSTFADLVREVGPLLRKDQALIDFCSLKKRETEVMLAHTSCEVVAAHPLFGPGEPHLAGQKVALWPARGQFWFRWFWDFLLSQGAKPILVDPEEHDKTMAIVQVINHFMLLALGRLLNEAEVPLELVKELATPSFARQIDILCRFADQDPYLYGTIQYANPQGEEMRQKYLTLAQEIAEIARRKDMDAFLKIFRQVQELGRRLKTEGS